MATVTERGSPKKKPKMGKDGPDANGSYPYPQHYGYPSHGAPGGYGYPPHQPPPPTHYGGGPGPGPGPSYQRGPQHPPSYGSSSGPGSGPGPGPGPAPDPNVYCQQVGSGYAGAPPPQYGMGQYNRPGPSGMYSNGSAGGYGSSNGSKASSRSSPRTTSSSTSRPDDLVRSASAAARRAKEDEKGRGSYRCGKCGVPKKGHVCPYQPKLKRRADEPPPEMRNAATQVEMDEFLVVRRLNLEIQGFPESYTAAPMGTGDVGSEAHPPPQSHHQQPPQTRHPSMSNGMSNTPSMSPRISMPSPSMPSGSVGVRTNLSMSETSCRTTGTDPMGKGDSGPVSMMSPGGSQR